MDTAVERGGKTKIYDSILQMLPGLVALEPEGRARLSISRFAQQREKDTGGTCAIPSTIGSAHTPWPSARGQDHLVPLCT